MNLKNHRLPKLNLLCLKDDLRPIMESVYITKDEVCATNAHVLAVFKTSDIFDEDFIEGITEPILIHSEEWKTIIHASSEFLFWSQESKGMLTLVKKNGQQINFSPKLESKEGEFPNYNAVIPESSDETLNTIGVNADFLQAIQKATFARGLRLEFTGQTEAIIVKPIGSDIECRAICMPVVI